MTAPVAPNVMLSYATALSAAATVCHFNGGTSVSHVFAGSNGDSFPIAELTLAFWVKTTAVSATAVCFAFTPNGAQAPKLTVANPVNLTITYQGAPPIVTGARINDGLWHHVLITIAPNGRTFGAVQLILDGVPVLQTPKGFVHAANDWFTAAGTLVLGMAGTGTGFTGDMSEFELWSIGFDGRLAATQLQRRAQVGRSGLVLVWGLYDAATTGTIAGGDPNPFVPSTMQFRTAAAAPGAYVQATWTPVSGATAYNFELYAIDGSWVQSVPNIAAAALPLNIDGVLLDQSYQARACSMNSSGEMGPWSSPVALSPIDLSGVMAAFNWPALNDPLLATWQPTDQSQSYLLLQTRDPLQSPAPVATSTTATSVDITADLTGDFGWTIGVRGVAASSIGPTEVPGAVTAPTMAFYYVSDGSGVQGSGSFQFSWPTATPLPNDFYFKVTKGNTVILTELLPGSQTSPVKFPSPEPVTIGDQFIGFMRTLGSGAITHLATRTVTARDIAQPQLGWQAATSLLPESLTAIWGSVVPNATYNIDLYQDLATTPIVEQDGVSALSFAMTSYLNVAPPHSYTLRVSAVLDGDIGPTNNVVTPPALGSVLTYVWTGAPTNAGVLSLAWTPVSTPGLEVYQRVFVNGALTPSNYGAVAFADGHITLPQPEGGYPEGTRLSCQAFGLGAGYMALPESGNATLHRLDQAVVTLTGNSAAKTLIAQWTAVNPATPGIVYRILINGAALGSPQAATSFDLTSYLAAAGATTFQTAATLDNSFAQPSAAASAPATAPALRYDYALNGQDTLTATWTAAAIVYLQMQLQGQPLVSQLNTTNGNSYLVTRPAGGFIQGNVYTASTKVCANATVGAFEQASATIYQLAMPVVTFAQAADAASVTAQWNDIRTPQQQGVTVDYQVRLNGQDQGAPQPGRSVTLTGLLDQAGAQAVAVQGQAQGSYGIVSVPTVLTTPETPTLTYDEVSQVLSASWPAVAGAQQYYANSVGPQSAIFARNWINPTTPTVTTSVNLTNPVAGATYSINARALAGGALTPFATASLVYRAVPGPSITQPMQDDVPNHRIVASWTFDPSACGLTNVVYLAQLLDAGGTPIGGLVETTNTTARLPYPAETADGTTLQVRVRATGNSLLGTWSQIGSIAVGSGLAKVVLTDFSFNDKNAMTIAWGAVASPQQGTAVTYSVMVTGSGLKAGVFPQTTTATSLNLPQTTTGVANETTYTATVQAVSPGPAGPVSAARTSKTGKLTPPDPGGGGGDQGGDPIGLANGTYTYSNTDFSVVGVAALDFATFYASAAPLPAPQNPIASDKPMGKRWNHTYNTWLYIPNPQPASDPYVAVAWGFGMISSYNWGNTIGALPKQGRADGSVLLRNADLSYTLVLKDQTLYNFSSSGRLTTIVSNIGNVVALSYSGTQLQRVTDNGSGRYLSFTYFTSGADTGRLQQVSDNAGRHVSYAYTGGDLTSFTNASGKSRAFSYWPQSLMKQANYESGDVIVYNEYDSQQRVFVQRDGNQMAGAPGSYTIAWSTGTGPNGLQTSIATVQDSANHQTVYTSLTESEDTISTVHSLANGNVQRVTVSYDGNGNATSQTVYEGPASGAATLGNTTSASYDGNFNLLTLTYSGNMGSAAFGYDSRNNLTSYTDLLGNVISSGFNSDNTLWDTRDALGARTVYTYKPGAIKGLIETVSVYPSNGLGGTSNTANVSRMTYTGQGQIETITNALGETTTYTYADNTGWLSSVKVADADGTVTAAMTYLRDPQSGRSTTRKTQYYNQPLADASTESFTYDDRGNVHTATDAAGRTTEYIYNPNNFLQTITYPPENGFSEQTDFGFTGNNLINAMTLSSASPRVVWGFGYDAVGRLTSRTDPNNQTTAFAYAMQADKSPAAPTTKSVVFPLLVGADKPYVQSLTLDSLGRPTALSDIAVQGVTPGVTTLAYATQRDPATGTNVMKITQTFPLVDSTQSMPFTQVSVYDAYDRVISVTDSAGKTWTANFSLATTANPTTVQTVATVTDPLGNQTVTVTDAVGRVCQRKKGRSAQDLNPAQWLTTSITYDSSGNPKQVVETGSDGASKPATTYAYSYDPQGHVLQTAVTPYGVAASASVYSFDKATAYVGLRAPAGIVETRSYNSRGLLKTYTDGRGNLLQYAYDAAGRFTTTILPGGQTIANVLDANGNRLQTTRNGAAEITRVFDTLNRMTSRTDNLMAKTVGYTYTPMNKVATLTYPDVATPLVYAYDGLGRLKTVTDWSNRATSYTYWPAGKLKDTTYPNGVVMHQTVDDANRITGFSTTVSGSVLASATYQFDAFSLPQTVDQLLPIGANVQADQTLTYDGDRLLTVNGGNLAYDSDGNMTAIPAVTGALQYNALRQLTAVGTAALVYDLDGLQTGLINGVSNRRFIKDPRDYRAPLIDQADPTSAVTTANSIVLAVGPLTIAPLPASASDQRPLTLLPARPPTLGPDQPDMFESLPVPNDDIYGDFPHMLDRTLVAENHDGTGRVRYVYGQGLISREEDGGAWQSYVFDGLGSTLALIDNTGAITDRFAYSPYGSILARQGTTVDPFLYNGRYGVADFGLGPLMMRFRPYQPTVMRFTSRDILYGNSAAPQTQNRYAFVRGDPAQLIDPLGLGGDHGGGGGLGGGAIAGIVLGIAAVVLIIGGYFFGGAIMTELGSFLVARGGMSLFGQLGRYILRKFPRITYQKLAELEMDKLATEVVTEVVPKVGSTISQRTIGL